MTIRAFLGAAALFAAIAHPASADYPEEPITVVVPFSAGGGSDVLIRTLARVIQEKELLDVPLTILNVGGAGGTLGSRRVKEADADGYTYLLSHFALLSAHATGVADYGLDAFEPVAQISSTCLIYAALEDYEHDTLAAAFDAAKAAPDTISEAINIGAVVHLTSWMATDAYGGVDLRYVQSGGGAKRFEFLYGGHVDLAQFSVAEFANFAPKGLKALALLDDQRNPNLPDIPTAKEQGIDARACVSDWVFAPKGTPAEVTQVMADAIATALETDEMKAFYAKDLRTPDFLTGADLEAAIQAQDAIIREVAERHADELK
ncbi:tripartite tricarboxylate transporter substrate binding protein [Rhodobacteraceae bacterium CCMM004]|nr:tripartite tricarboxylate transporter substrate binding protein [Rhodobacteraceae bacterium CCMM004]